MDKEDKKRKLQENSDDDEPIDDTNLGQLDLQELGLQEFGLQEFGLWNPPPPPPSSRTVYTHNSENGGGSAQLVNNDSDEEAEHPLKTTRSLFPVNRNERLKLLGLNRALLEKLLLKLGLGQKFSFQQRGTLVKYTQENTNIPKSVQLPLLTLTDVRVRSGLEDRVAIHHNPSDGGMDDQSDGGMDDQRDSGMDDQSDGGMDGRVVDPEYLFCRAGGAIFPLKLSSLGTTGLAGKMDDDGEMVVSVEASLYESAKKLILLHKEDKSTPEEAAICSLANLLEYNSSSRCRTTPVFGGGGAVNSLVGSAYRDDDASTECKNMLTALTTASDTQHLEMYVADPGAIALVEILFGLGIDRAYVESQDGGRDEFIEFLVDLWFNHGRDPSTPAEQAEVRQAIELGIEQISDIKHMKHMKDAKDKPKGGSGRRKYTSKKRSSRKSKTIKKIKNKRTSRQRVEKRRPSARSSRKHSRSKK